jgi:hypothetical protein
VLGKKERKKENFGIVKRRVISPVRWGNRLK